jgi:hypothetical protein
MPFLLANGCAKYAGKSIAFTGASWHSLWADVNLFAQRMAIYGHIA